MGIESDVDDISARLYQVENKVNLIHDAILRLLTTEQVVAINMYDITYQWLAAKSGTESFQFDGQTVCPPRRHPHLNKDKALDWPGEFAKLKPFVDDLAKFGMQIDIVSERK